jgi:hypothetical protein
VQVTFACHHLLPQPLLLLQLALINAGTLMCHINIHTLPTLAVSQLQLLLLLLLLHARQLLVNSCASKQIETMLPTLLSPSCSRLRTAS